MTTSETTDLPSAPNASAGSDLPRLGLALGGGGARGLAHISILEVVEELGLPIACLSGTSIGSIIGWGIASGMSGPAMRDYALSTFGDSREVAARAWRMRPKGLGTFFQGLGTQLDPLVVLEAFLPDHNLADTFDKLSIPLAVNTTDYYGWRSQTFSTGAIKPRVAASIAIPFVFKPAVLDGRVHVDGGVVNPLPTGGLGPCDLVVAVDVIGGPTPQGENGGNRTDEPPTQMESILGATQLCMQTITRAHLEQHPPDVLIRPPIETFPALNFLKTREVLEAADSRRDQVKRTLSEAVERWMMKRAE